MKKYFWDENVLEYIKTFPNDQAGLEFTRNEKYKDGYRLAVVTTQSSSVLKKHNKKECTKYRYKETTKAEMVCISHQWSQLLDCCYFSPQNKRY